MPKASVVGAGITGCIAALHLRRFGYDVNIFDSAPAPGGLLRDIQCSDQKYFSGCQYLTFNAAWLTRLRAELACNLVDFEHTYGSYTALLDAPIAHRDFAGPVIGRTFSESRACLPELATLRSRLMCYPAEVGERLLKWTAGFNTGVADAHHSCALAMQVSRVYFQYDDVALLKARSGTPIADQIIGMPRSVLQPSARPALATIPEFGFDAFFARLRTHLENEGITFSLNAPIVPRLERDSRFRIECRGSPIDTDLIVWATNPIPLMHSAGLGKLDNPACRMVVHACDVAGSRLPGPAHYIQVYGDHPITRIYVYRVDGQPRASIECFDKANQPVEPSLREAERILSCFDIDCHLAVKTSVRQRRFILYSVKDYTTLGHFEKAHAHSNLVGGAWREYGRNARIDQIMRQLTIKLDSTSAA